MARCYFQLTNSCILNTVVFCVFFVWINKYGAWNMVIVWGRPHMPLLLPACTQNDFNKPPNWHHNCRLLGFYRFVRHNATFLTNYVAFPLPFVLSWLFSYLKGKCLFEHECMFTINLAESLLCKSMEEAFLLSKFIDIALKNHNDNYDNKI